MNDLRELTGQTVTATIDEDINGNEIYLKCKIISLHINDFYFEEKGEPIYITVNVDPIDNLPEDFDYDCLIDISLSNIRK